MSQIDTNVESLYPQISCPNVADFDGDGFNLVGPSDVADFDGDNIEYYIHRDLMTVHEDESPTLYDMLRKSK